MRAAGFELFRCFGFSANERRKNAQEETQASAYIARVDIRTPRSLASCISFADFSTESASSDTPTSTKRAYVLPFLLPQIGTGVLRSRF
jgi:hypothetical protein